MGSVHSVSLAGDAEADLLKEEVLREFQGRTRQRRVRMRTAPIVGGLVVVLVSAWAARAEPTRYTITANEVMVRSGPSPEFYPTSRLRRGDEVRVVREETTGWLAIVPPPGSFSWINTRVVEQTSSNPHVVSAAFIRVGSRVVNQEPIVERFKVAAGTIVAVIGRAEPGRDGTWLPIRPVPSEVRYIPAEAILPSAAPRQLAAASPEPVKPPSSQAGFASPHPAAPATSPMDDRRAAQPPAPFLATANNASAANRLTPAPVDSCSPTAAALAPPPAAAAPSQYCYLQDSNYTARLAPPLLPSPNPPPGRPEQWYEPGRLWPTAFFVDGKRAYRLEPVGGNKMWMYVTAGGNVNLDPYVGKVISVYGSTMYRGDLRTNYMAVVQVSPVNRVR
jgi:hypothetical protein